MIWRSIAAAGHFTVNVDDNEADNIYYQNEYTKISLNLSERNLYFYAWLFYKQPQFCSKDKIKLYLKFRIEHAPAIWYYMI